MIHKNKYFVLFLTVFIVYMYLNIPVIKNSNFVADDVMVLYMSKADPFPVFNHWTESLQSYYDIPNKPGYFYRPIHSLMMYLSILVFGFNPVYFTVLSLIIQFGIFLLLYNILVAISGSDDDVQKKYLFLMSVLFLFYPPNFVNTSWISGRVDLILTLFLLLSFYFSVIYLKNGDNIYLLGSLTFFVSALLTKDNAILFAIPELCLFYLSPLSMKIIKGYRKNLFVLTTILGCIYLFIRLFVLKIYPPLNYGEIRIFEVFIIILRSLVEFIIPVDSGVLMNLTGEYGVWIIILFFVYLSVFVLFLAGNIKSAKEKRKMVLILLMIPVFTFAFYYFRGGLSFRFYSSTFAFWLIGLAVFSVWNKRTSIFTVACKNICISFILIVFIFGSYNVVSAWSKSFIESRKFFNQFVNFNTEKEIVLLNYPHSLNNSYCFSDIDYAFGFYKTGSFRKYPCFIQGAATSMYSPSDYDNIMVECRQLCDTVFVLSSNSPNCYFLPFPFYNESIYINDTIEISKNVSFIPQNSVVVSTWFQKAKTNSIKLLIRKSYKERMYLYYSEGKLIELK